MSFLMKIMPFLDLMSCFIIFLHLTFGMFKITTIFYIALYLIIKGLIFSFSKDFASIVDLICGLYVALILVSGASFAIINILIIIWLLQKGLFGMMS